MVDSRSTSLSRGMRDHSSTRVGEEMSQVQSGSYQKERAGAVRRAERSGHLRQVRESPGDSWIALRTTPGARTGKVFHLSTEGSQKESGLRFVR